MDPGSSFNLSDVPESIDRSRVLVLKPMKCLVPVFVDGPGAPSGANPQPNPFFTCPQPNGPYPSGVQAFYPFLAQDDAQRGSFCIPNQPGGSTFNPFGARNDAQQALPTTSNQPSGSTFCPRVVPNDAQLATPLKFDQPGVSAFNPCVAPSDAMQAAPITSNQPSGSTFYPHVAPNDAQLATPGKLDRPGSCTFNPCVAPNDAQLATPVKYDQPGVSAFNPSVAPNDAKRAPPTNSNQPSGFTFYHGVASQAPPVTNDRPSGSAFYRCAAQNDVPRGPHVIQDRFGGSAFNDTQRAPFVTPDCLGGSKFNPFAILDRAHEGPHVTPIQPTNFGFGGNIPNPILSGAFMVPTSQANVGGYQGTDEQPITLDDDTYSELLTQNAQPESGLGTHGNAVNIAECNEVNIVSSSTKRKRGRPRKKMDTENVDEISLESVTRTFLTAFNLTDMDEFKRSRNDREIVSTILLVYDLIRRKLSQLEDTKNNLASVVTRRRDLKIGALFMSSGIRANGSKKIVGRVPGIEVGDIFYFRMEMCIVGLHGQSMGGIDYITDKTNMEEEALAVSIVSSGGYENDGDDGNMLIYSGQGGVQRKDGQMFDQKLERGNLALEKSHNRNSDVRVIRGVKDPAYSYGKIYIYDGLYKVENSWSEKNIYSCTVFKYRLVRIPGQPEAYSTWKSIQQWKDGTAPRPGIICADLSAGAENQPVVVVNDVDGERGPAHFTYMCSLKYTKKISISIPSPGCNCIDGCLPDHVSCMCTQKNGGHLPYGLLGIVLTDQSLIHECGASCKCPPECQNRASQAGLRIRLEVFKTSNRGWGLRSWDPIRAGGFICEYAGDVIGVSNANNFSSSDGNNDYIFDTTRYYEPLERVHDKSAVVGNATSPLVISAKKNGNVARFMNHSCTPNVYWKLVLRESNHERFLHVAFFAIRHIPPLKELTFDYGIVPPGKGCFGRKTCLCGSKKCRGYFY